MKAMATGHSLYQSPDREEAESARRRSAPDRLGQNQWSRGADADGSEVTEMLTIGWALALAIAVAVVIYVSRV